MPKKSTPNKRGRPVRQDIDRDMIRKLAMIGCSHQEIANRVGCSRETLEQRFRSEIEEGQSDGRVQARAKIFQKGVVNGEFATAAPVLPPLVVLRYRPHMTIFRLSRNFRFAGISFL
jgi:hypothetical protein